ncbi:MAG TPA: HD domain-containing protein [Bacteroidales bacterium]|jgi:putative nucleotidyltransferase with HDIG domain|nr:HD domain-containing protein [Bacteroidales bacterium]MDY0160342.1 HD domain-containing protein [Bacteroidales bacterium]HXK82130.1 HD domain-containing protein [Bacteroidales bacterium]
MISESDIKKWQLWLKEYVNQHITGDQDTDVNINMKYQHSLKVANNARVICQNLNMKDSECRLAYICGLFHDIGRFRQYKVYHTFVDSQSIYHGELGVDVLEKLNILKGFNKKHAKIIKDAVYNHGLLNISDRLNGDYLLFTNIIRDADKLDIYRIVTDYYRHIETRNVAIELGLYKGEKVTEQIITALENAEVIRKEELIYLNDFKILQISWIFDLNFDITKELILKNNFIDLIISSIEGDSIRDRVKQIIYKHINH